MKKPLAVLLLLAVLGIGVFVWHNNRDTNNLTGAADDQTAANSRKGFDKTARSLDSASSLWVVVNKHRSLRPGAYAPDDLSAPNVPLRLSADTDEMKMTRSAGKALEQLFAGAKKDDLNLQISSAYRSFAYQTSLYNHYVEVQGKAVADSQSARPGFSEHQTGLAVDVEPVSRTCEVEQCFADTPEGKWVAANAYKYGFIIRYPKDMQNVTGYIYEPWHIRYVGTSLSTEMHNEKVLTLEQFFGLGDAPDYK